jgi:hypothetical protein
MKAADGCRDGNQGPKRMDMWQIRCRVAAAAARYSIFDSIIFMEDLGRQVKNQLEEKVF